MDIQIAIDWVESIKKHYGRNVEAVMEDHLKAHPHSAQVVAQQTIAFGIDTDDAQLMNFFMEHGGDVVYLKYVADCFVKVRSKYFGL